MSNIQKLLLGTLVYVKYIFHCGGRTLLGPVVFFKKKWII